MCTLIILRDAAQDGSLLLASSRDEFYERPTAPPHWLLRRPTVFAGQDLTAGGTWLGVRKDGYFAAITNQPSSVLGAAARSRGQLVLGVLEQPDPAAATDWLSAQRMSDYRPFNLIFGRADDVRLAYGRDDLTWDDVPSGISVLTNGPLNSARFPKVQRIHQQWTALRKTGDAPLDVCKAILSDPWYPEPLSLDAVVDSEWPLDIQARLHGVNVQTESYGTRSSAIISLGNGRVSRYLYCDMPIRPDGFVDLTEELLGTHLNHEGSAS